MFIDNVNISGYSVTANVHGKVGALLSQTSQHVLTLLRRIGFKQVGIHSTYSKPHDNSIACLTILHFNLARF